MAICACAMVGGYSDVISLQRWGSFVTMCTGNTVMTGATLLSENPFGTKKMAGPEYYITLNAAWFAGSVVYRAAERRWPHRGATMLALPFGFLMFTLEMFVIMYSGSLEELRSVHHFTAHGYAPMFGMLCSACIQSRLGTTTTMITGHLLILSDLILKLVVDRSLTRDDLKKMRAALCVGICTILGAVAGTLVMQTVAKDSRGGLLPVGPVLVLLLYCLDHLSKPQTMVKKISKITKEGLSTKRASQGDDDEDTSVHTGVSDDDEGHSRGP